MGRVVIILSTMLVVFALISHKRNNGKKIIHKLKETIVKINKTYIDLFSRRGKIISEVYGLIFIISEIFLLISFLKIGINNILSDKTVFSICITLVSIVACLILIHLVIGYILLITSGIQRFIVNVENRNLKNNLVISYFILTTYITVFIFDSTSFEGVHLIALVGLLISYTLNLKALVKIIKNPIHVKSKNEDQSLGKGIVIISILLLSMIVLNLFMAVCIINQIYPGSFSNNPQSIDLFYYTVITFTTIGYGDIVPIGIPAKIISMIIAVTSVVCITVFLSTVLSYREEQI